MKITLSGPVDFWDVYRKLSCYYFRRVEKIIENRLPHTVLVHREKFKGAQTVIDGLLEDSVMQLKTLIPGAGVFWDDRVDVTPTYESYPYVVVDVVDGTKELKKGGTEVASTLAIVLDDKKIPICIISYPFGRERIVDVKGRVYRLPNKFSNSRLEPKVIEDYRLSRRSSRADLSELRVSERYDLLDDDLRNKLDELRYELEGPIIRPAGSISKMLMALVIGTCDIFVRKTDRPVGFFDYLAPSKIITDLGGVFLDLDGNKPDGVSSISGIVAASTEENYNLFMGYLRG